MVVPNIILNAYFKIFLIKPSKFITILKSEQTITVYVKGTDRYHGM